MNDKPSYRCNEILKPCRGRQAVAGAVLLGIGVAAMAQGYPGKPIRLIVPFPPGGANDIVARIVNIKLPGLLGQNLIIDNRAGAGGNLGAEIAAKSAPTATRC